MSDTARRSPEVRAAGSTAAVTMAEGHTPLIPSVGVARLVGARNLFFKLESCNPSGSYKDRFVTAEVRRILDAGGRACIATSSGNTGSALAACCARYGLRCLIVVNADAPEAKLLQMQAHGAIMIRVQEFVTSPDATRYVFTELERLTRQSGTSLVVSAYRYCPQGMAAVESIAHELASALPEVAHVFVPVGGGGLYSAVVRGFQTSAASPLVHAVQPEGCPTVLRAVARDPPIVEGVESTTRISGLSVPFDIDALLAVRCLVENRGHAIGVSDEEVFEAQRLLLRSEGIYAEPAGAAALAGYWKMVKQKRLDMDAAVVCLVTGHGFKDPESMKQAARLSSIRISPTELMPTLLRLLE